MISNAHTCTFLHSIRAFTQSMLIYIPSLLTGTWMTMRTLIVELHRQCQFHYEGSSPCAWFNTDSHYRVKCLHAIITITIKSCLFHYWCPCLPCRVIHQVFFFHHFIVCIHMTMLTPLFDGMNESSLYLQTFECHVMKHD